MPEIAAGVMQAKKGSKQGPFQCGTLMCFLFSFFFQIVLIAWGLSPSKLGECLLRHHVYFDVDGHIGVQLQANVVFTNDADYPFGHLYFRAH